MLACDSAGERILRCQQFGVGQLKGCESGNTNSVPLLVQHTNLPHRVVPMKGVCLGPCILALWFLEGLE
eukprot:8513968-Ditylum_brightwellii.AAC.1